MARGVLEPSVALPVAGSPCSDFLGSFFNAAIAAWSVTPVVWSPLK
jgi:hypothetical protein